jgi:hypothetical protein
VENERRERERRVGVDCRIKYYIIEIECEI